MQIQSWETVWFGKKKVIVLAGGTLDIDLRK